MAIEIDLHSPSESQWIDSTYPSHGDSDVGRTDDIKVRFDRLVSTSSLVAETFKLYSQSGDEVDGAFRPINVSNDYNPITQEIVLHLGVVLDPEASYTLVVDGLFDAAGDDQDLPHVVSFITNEFDADLTPDVGEVNQIGIVDYTINDKDLVETSVTGAHSSYMNPADQAYNIAEDQQTLTVRFSPLDVDAATTTVKRRPISLYETPWSTVGVTDEIVNSVITITLPAVSAGVYVEEGYEYWVNVVIDETSESFDFYFLGSLDPMLASVSSVLMQFPGMSSYEAARLIYINTATALDIDPAQASNPSKAGGDYVLFSTLWQIATGAVTVSFVLGDLEVKEGKESRDARWERLMDQALSRLQKANPKVLIKGGANTSPHAARDWDSTGSTKRRIGKTE